LCTSREKKVSNKLPKRETERHRERERKRERERRGRERDVEFIKATY